MINIAEFKGLPFPPSVNSLYRHNAGRSEKVARFKTAKAKDWETLLDIWHLKNRRLILEAKAQIHKLLHDNKVFLYIGLEFIVPPQTLYSKQNKLKRIDCTNRIKATLDGLSNILGVDDNRFFLDKVEFVLGNDKYINIKIYASNMRYEDNGK